MELRELVGGVVQSVAPEATLEAAATQMDETGVGSLAVLDKGDLVGIFTERDVVRAVASGELSNKVSVGDWMTAFPDSSVPEMGVREAADWMLASGYRHLPVHDGFNLLGMVSIKDILWALTGEGD